MIRGLLVVCWSAALLGCPDEGALVQIEEQIDHYTQSDRPKVDVLWVIDNSSSMGAEQEKIVREGERFLERLEQASLDYHVGVITTDPSNNGVLRRYEGSVEGCDHCRFIDRPLPIFRDLALVGTAGSPLERAFQQAAHALIDPPQENAGFLRADADLLIIFVSDEEEGLGSVDVPVRYYERLFASLKAKSEQRVHVVSIAGWPIGGLDAAEACAKFAPLFDGDGANDGALPGELDEHARANGCFDLESPLDENAVAFIGLRYLEIACRFGGELANICARDYGETLERISEAAVRLGRVFALRRASSLELGEDCKALSGDEPALDCDENGSTEDDVDGPICVRASIGDAEAAPIARDAMRGWSFDPAAGAIAFQGELVPAPGSEVEVRYKLSGTENRCAR